MTFSGRVTSITQDKLVPVSIDAVLNSNVFLARTFQRDVKRWSGHILRVPIQVSKPTTGGAFDGVDTFDTSLSDTRQQQSFSPTGEYQSVVVSGIENSVNTTDAEVLNLVKVSMQEAQNAMEDNLGTKVYSTQSGKNIQGLGNIVDDGTNSSTYGTLSRTTYSLLNSTVTASGGALTLTNLGTVFRGASAASSNRQRPTILVTTETVWDLYESLLTPTVQANYQAAERGVVTAFSRPGSVMGGDALQGQQGFQSLKWRGIPVVADEKADSGVVFMLNEEYLHWYSLKGQDLKSYSMNYSPVDSVASEYKKVAPIQWKDLQSPTNQYAQVGQFIAMGNLISEHTRRHGKLTGVTTA